MRTAAAALLALALGCSAQPRFDTPGEGLDQVVFYTEQSKRQGDYALSGADPAGKVEKLPRPALVDVNSCIALGVRKDRIVAGQAAGDPTLSQKVKALDEREKDVLAAVQALERLMEHRRALIDLHLQLQQAAAEQRAETLEKFLPVKRAVGQEMGKVLNTIRDVMSSDPGALDRMMAEEERRPKERFAIRRSYLNDALKDVDLQQASLAAQVRARRLTFRLEAFLTAPGRDPEAIHLEHYDDLDAGKVQRRDPFGLDLSAEEMKRVKELMATSRKLADRLNAVHRGELSLEVAFADATEGMLGRVGDLIREATALYADAQGVRKAVEELAADLRALAAQADGILKDAAKAAMAEAMKRADEELATAVKLVERLFALRDDWKKRGAAALPDALLEVPDLVAELEKAAKAVATPEGRKDLRERVEAAAQAALQAAGDAAAPPIKAGWEKARPKVEKIAAFLGKIRDAAELLAKVVDLKETRPLPDSVRTTSAFDVPVEQLKNTSIELERTSRKPGDLVQVRATLLRGQEELERHAASFEVAQFGWHGHLAPSVVLTRPFEMESTGDEDFNFAPSLSWLWRYTPRPEQPWGYAPLRFLDPSLGPHATFLNFDPDEDFEVGLGGTLGLWNDRVLMGAGYNLMAEKSDEGGWYFFVGSSLIALLQDLGVAEK